MRRLALRLAFGRRATDQSESCHQFGDCGLEVYLAVKRLIGQGVSNFKVIDGKVYLNNDRDHPVDHTWIEMNGRVQDPTDSQFRGAPVDYTPEPGEYREEYTPQQYIQNFEGQYGDLL